MRDTAETGGRAGLRRQVEVFLLAVQFLTRLPVPRDLPWSEERQAASMAYLPLVGLCVGAIGGLILWGAAQVFPMMVAVLMSLAATLWVTGAFHEDGLADAADGLGGGATQERALEIMRDSRIGSYGAVTLGVVLALKVAGLVALPLGMAVAVLALGHGISRYGAVLVMFLADYARAEGAKFAPPTISAGGHGVALASAVAMAAGLVALVGFAGVVGLLGSAILGGVVTRAYLRKLGGFTGDCLGATQQMAELGLILGVLAWV
ncbi:adenosylcobinamide-GDP ribazoletransferase [Roseicyclus marinus]|uniref:adenosylcobinamide-GDP ribazoletransferase n=1 Tax=Roseicyclus marinus TaxID=2161673 RepID=UPI00240F15DD|nr:adenosylcobinamide-GDP ribazoletransferase [Roseicyclus marinus]MDG3040401.1 adenosylcobinamide-GDP ribazoletransferase [Roseicyclus marinus]